MINKMEFQVWDKQLEKMVSGIGLFLSPSGKIWENKRDGMEGTDDLIRTDRYLFILAGDMEEEHSAPLPSDHFLSEEGIQRTMDSFPKLNHNDL